MREARIFPEHVRVELLAGVLYQNPDRKRPRPGPRRKIKLVNRPPSGPMNRAQAHDYPVLAVGSKFQRLLSGEWLVSERRSIALGVSWWCTPDLVVLKGPVARYRTDTPTTSDVALIVEVADASYPRDRNEKCRRYAFGGVPIYWIVNLIQRQVEVYSQPSGKGMAAAYDSVAIYGNDAAVPVIIDGAEVGRVNVVDLLPSVPAAGT